MVEQHFSFSVNHANSSGSSQEWKYQQIQTPNSHSDFDSLRKNDLENQVLEKFHPQIMGRTAGEKSRAGASHDSFKQSETCKFYEKIQ